MSWAAWLCRTMTGDVIRPLDLSGGSVQHTLNGIGDWSITCAAEEVLARPVRDWYPWVTSVLICHKAGDNDMWQPVIFGPVTAMPVITRAAGGQAADTMTLSGHDIRAILQRRLQTGYRDWPVPDSTWKLQHEQIMMRGMSLGTIAEKLVAISTERREGGALPIRYRPDLWQSNLPRDDSHTRRYYAWNLHNNSIDKLLTDLTECEGGPDIVFRPGIKTDGAGNITGAYATMLHGKENQPQVPMSHPAVLWDLTAPEGPVSGVTTTFDASALWTRRWATGDGIDADVLMDVRQSRDMHSAGMPLMEDVTGYSSIITHGALLRHVDELVAAGRRPGCQWTVTAQQDIWPGKVGFDWFLGERVRLRIPWELPRDDFVCVAGHPIKQEDTEILATVMAMNLDLTSELATIDLQEDR